MMAIKKITRKNKAFKSENIIKLNQKLKND